jgi:hypothetical protein
MHDLAALVSAIISRQPLDTTIIAQRITSNINHNPSSPSAMFTPTDPCTGAVDQESMWPNLSIVAPTAASTSRCFHACNSHLPSVQALHFASQHRPTIQPSSPAHTLLGLQIYRSPSHRRLPSPTAPQRRPMPRLLLLRDKGHLPLNALPI